MNFKKNSEPAAEKYFRHTFILRTLPYVEETSYKFVLSQPRHSILLMFKESLSGKSGRILLLTILLLFGFVSLYSQDLKKQIEGKSFAELNALADTLIKQSSYQQLIPIYEKAREQALKEFGKESMQYAGACGKLAIGYQGSDLFAKAEPFYTEQKEIYKKIKGELSPEYIETSLNIGWLYHVLDNSEKAEQSLLETKALAEKAGGKENPSYIQICYALGDFYKDQGDYIGAQSLYLEAKDLSTGILDTLPDYYSRISYSLAELYEQEGLYLEAENSLAGARDTIRKYLGVDNLIYSYVCSALGDFYNKLQNYSKAEKYYLEDISISEKIFGRDHSQYGARLNNLASYYKNQGNYDTSEVLYNEVRAIYEKAWGKKSEYAIVTKNLSFLYLDQGRYDRALKLMLEVKDIASKYWGKDHSEYGIVCNQLARIYEAQHMYKKAEPLYLKDLQIVESKFGINHPDYALTSGSLAYFYEKQGLYDKAEIMYDKVIRNKINQTKILLPTLTEKERQEYIRSIQKFFYNYYDFALHNLKPSVLSNLFNLQLETKGIIFHSTQKMKDQILSSNDTTLIKMYHYWKEKRSLLSQMLQMSLEEKEKLDLSDHVLSQEIDELERKLSKQSQSFSKNKSGDDTWKDVQNNLREGEALVEIVRAYKLSSQMVFDYYGKGYQFDTSETGGFSVVSVYAGSPAEIVGIKAGAEMLAVNGVSVRNKTREELIKMMAAESYEISFRNLSSSKALTQVLVSDSIYTEETISLPVYLALILHPKSLNPEVVILENGEELETKSLSHYQNTIQFKLQDKNSYEHFWKKIKEKTNNAKKVYVSADGVFHQINLLTLQNPETKQYVADEVEIQLITNSSDIIKFKNKTDLNDAVKENRFYLFGYPDYDGKKDSIHWLRELVPADTSKRFFNRGESLSMLPGTKVEVEYIYNILKNKFPATYKYLYSDATEDTLKKITNPSILHIATHGFFLPDKQHETEEESNPLQRSGLLLANCLNENESGEDGVLTAEEAMNLHLDYTDLVVLSACETGLGEISNGEGVYGLQRAFQQAGAGAVIMSLWKVSDAATQEMMTFFYKYYLEGLSKREAFTIAQKELRNKFKEPYYWGAFVMVGE